MQPVAPWRAPDVGAPRRFEARGGRNKVAIAGIMVASVALIAGMGALNWIAPDLQRALMPVFVLAFIAGYGVFLVWLLRGRPVRLDVGPDTLVVDAGGAGTFPLAGCRLGLWRTPGTGVIGGSVLHVSDGRRVYRIGGRDHRPAPGVALVAPVTEGIEVYLSADEFEALLRCVPLGRSRVDAGADARANVAPATLRCELVPNPASARGAFVMMVPWLIAMGLSAAAGGLVGVLSETFGVPSTPLLAVGIIAPILLGGLVGTIVLAYRRKAPALAIELDGREVRLRNPRTNVVVSTAPLGSVAVTRAMHRTAGRMSVEYPLVTLRMPGRPPLSVGVYDWRYSWNDRAPFVWSGPRYVVGTPDWNALTEVLGVRGFVAVGRE
jgi:hypothetical protein